MNGIWSTLAKSVAQIGSKSAIPAAFTRVLILSAYAQLVKLSLVM